jgi:hypothetical protein
MQPKQRHAWTYVEGTLSGQYERSSGPGIAEHQKHGNLDARHFTRPVNCC